MKFKEILVGESVCLRLGDDVRMWTKFDCDLAQSLQKVITVAVRAGEAVAVTGLREGKAVKVKDDTAKETATKVMDILSNTEKEIEPATAKARWEKIDKQPHLRVVFKTPRTITLRWSSEGRVKDQKVEVSEIVVVLPNGKDQDPDSAILVRSGDKVRAFAKNNPEHWMREAGVWLYLYKVLKEANRVRD
jgi:hypothetical protein